MNWCTVIISWHSSVPSGKHREGGGGQYIEDSSEVFLQIISKSAFPDHPTTIDRMIGCNRSGQNEVPASCI